MSLLICVVGFSCTCFGTFHIVILSILNTTKYIILVSGGEVLPPVELGSKESHVRAELGNYSTEYPLGEAQRRTALSMVVQLPREIVPIHKAVHESVSLLHWLESDASMYLESFNAGHSPPSLVSVIYPLPIVWTLSLFVDV